MVACTSSALPVYTTAQIYQQNAWPEPFTTSQLRIGSADTDCADLCLPVKVGTELCACQHSAAYQMLQLVARSPLPLLFSPLLQKVS